MSDPASTSSASPDTTVLCLRGVDALPLLHRISTQTLLDLSPGTARATLFCDFRGRLLHRALVCVAQDRLVWLIRDDAPGASLASFLDRHVFREDVAIEDRSNDLAVSRAESMSDSSEAGGVPRHVASGNDRFEIGAERRPPDHLARILAGRPAHGHEIVEDYNPFEVGLGDDVHLDKGCYTGQEALQRLMTYHSVRRGLALLRGRGTPPAPRTAVEFDGERAGAVTSAIVDSADGWIGLGVIRLERLESGTVPVVAGTPLRDHPEPFESPRPLGRP